MLMEQKRGQVYTKNSAMARKVRAEALGWKQGKSMTVIFERSDGEKRSAVSQVVGKFI